ncbi:GTP-binding protein [Candidatus Woesearchaeota archaeon]|nr:MAG: GTP-binding protein [Candidatus Woesearchaeota archaeon]
MASYQEKIRELEQLISKTKYNKRTQHAIGLYKAQLAKLKEKEAARGKAIKKGESYAVKRSGDATVIIVGFPSVGKSTLLNVLTGAKSAVGSYAFTTLKCIPGLMKYKHAEIQILDVPGVVHGAASGRGRGKEVLAVMRNADLAIILLDVNYPGHLKVLKNEINNAGIRLNQERPDVKITKTDRGGIKIGKTVKIDLSNRTIIDILKEFKIVNAEIVIRSVIGIDQLIDVIEKNKVYMPAIIVLNKIDTVGPNKLQNVIKAVKPDICISAEKNIGINELKEMIYQKLRLIPIYCKQVGKKADLDVPLILKNGATLKTMCEKLHKDFVSKFKFARIWGKSAKFPGQRKLKLNHKLEAGDIVEIHLG